MAESWGGSRNRRKAGWVAPWFLALLTGCSLTPGKSMTLFPESHTLLKTTKEVRDAYQAPLPLPRELNKGILTDYVVEPGDVLFVQPADLASPARLPGDQPVVLDGTINLGRYGRIIVAGKTVPEIEALVRTNVEAQTKNAGPMVVRVVTRDSKVYYVLGEVNAPGAYPLRGRETVLDGIIAAGGLTERASRDNIIFTRPTPPDSCRMVLPICYRNIVQLGDTSTNYQIAPGDRIFVPSRTFWEGLHPGPKQPKCGPCAGPQVPCSEDAPGWLRLFRPVFHGSPEAPPSMLAPPVSAPSGMPAWPSSGEGLPQPRN